MRGPLFYLIDFFTGRQPIEMFIYSLFGVLAFVFICIPVHECAHAFVAKRLGDDTAERQGRLTLNPFAHIDLMGVVMMFVCSIGWAKPTPVDLRRCNKVKVRTANLLVSAAGPLSNLIMAFLFTIICKLLLVLSIKNANITLYQIAQIVLYIANLNAFLAVFNLIPVPPLDGYRIMKEIFISYKNQRIFYNLERYSMIISGILIMFISRTGRLGICVGAVDDLLRSLGGLIYGA